MEGFAVLAIILLVLTSPVWVLLLFAAAAAGTMKEAELIIKPIIAAHIKALSARRRQTAPLDAYGNRDARRWRKEQDYFIETVLKDKVRELPPRESIGAWIDQAVDEFESAPEQQASPLMQPVDSNMSPEEYEHHCAGLLRGLGWATRVTKASGDQGVDVVAEKGGHKVVIQCKKYSKPVGNKAVQEVIAAMQFEDANSAAVVSNNSFTPSARALANKSGVLLLYHSELERLDELAGVEREAPPSSAPVTGGLRPTNAAPKELRVFTESSG